ncbi:MAG: PSD1 and planctomycete cytochrome C domain-containing protein [Phycisphaerales bacterium]
MRRMTVVRLVVCGAGALVVAGAGGAMLSGGEVERGVASERAGGKRVIRYGRDIRPLLSDRCFQCHGPDPKTRQANLRLDEREDALLPRKDSGPAIVPGKPGESELVRRITATDVNVKMPPADSHKRALSTDEVELFREWIEQGAVYEKHWAFVAPERPVVPEVSEAGARWCRNAIDRFVMARLESEGITPSAEADADTLIRRVFLDVTGLPPTPEEVGAFEAAVKSEETPGSAYEALVDRLLTQEPYATRHAERMTAAWLDQARYADTCGIHMDAGRQMWLWRDWVIDAYRANKPFDEFIIEQLAGDLLPEATVAQKIATGFNRNHVTTDEGGAIAEEYLVEYAVDRTNTTGSVLLGLTVGCARCHDHKFDPITTEDFYSLYAFFNSIEEPGLYSQLPDPNRAFEPFLAVPTKEQEARLAAIKKEGDELRATLEERTPEEEAQRVEFFRDVWTRAGVRWAESEVVAATSTREGGAVLTAQSDGSVVASGPNPAKDEHRITIRTEGVGLRVMALEALLEPSAFEGRVGRANNGNAVLKSIAVEAVSVKDAAKREPVKFMWAWADHSQRNGDFEVTNIIDEPTNARDDRGWAVQGHEMKQPRVAMLLSEKAFGYEGGTDLIVTLNYDTLYSQHVLARVRLSVGTLNEVGTAMLPSTASRWYRVGSFPGDDQNRVYEPEFGPEQGDRIDLKKGYGADGKQMWRFDERLADETLVNVSDARNVTYVGKYVYAPTAREVAVSLGSDDGFRLYVNGEEQVSRKVDRGLAANQDQGTLRLRAGRNAVVMKIVNTGGPGGYYFRSMEQAELPGDLAGALLPERVTGAVGAAGEGTGAGSLGQRMGEAWRVTALPKYKQTQAALAKLDEEKKQIEGKVPLTMVMKELGTPRETFVLKRGEYDKADKERPVTRRLPRSLGTMPEGAPANRLGLAEWVMSRENPLTARVTVNRLWEMLFGTGIVKTSEDFGQQGDWPSHPELLDWLAVEFRDGYTSGEDTSWDVNHMLRLILTSATYRQASQVRAELRERDPENRLLAYFPRRRLSAEQIRDQALYAAGLLVEKAGGPSVKPYQPEGLWKEVAMPQSNTREFKRGMGEDLWRRSMYTYWKRAAPPPAMLTFDAPTREFCTIRRATTSTPLQALVLWNDEQFVEAARVLAQRTLATEGDEESRLRQVFSRLVARAPSPGEVAKLRAALGAFRERYAAAPEDAEGMLKLGESPRAEGVEAAELAAWTMIASSVMNLYEATTQH